MIIVLSLFLFLIVSPTICFHTILALLPRNATSAYRTKLHKFLTDIIHHFITTALCEENVIHKVYVAVLDVVLLFIEGKYREASCCKPVQDFKRRVHKRVPTQRTDTSLPHLGLSPRDLPLMPCFNKASQRANFLVLKWAKKVCSSSFLLPPIPSTSRNKYQIVLVESKGMFLNITMLHFSFAVQAWCDGDFLQLVSKVRPRGFKTEYVFCGKKHPWEIIYTGNEVMFDIVARPTSSFTFLYQAMSRYQVTKFKLCHTLVCITLCQSTTFDKMNKSFGGHVMLYPSHTFSFSLNDSYLIFHMIAKKFQVLKLSAFF